MQKLKELTTEIQTILPEIMELKFGCEIKTKDDFYKVVNVISYISTNRVEHIKVLDQNYNQQIITGGLLRQDKDIKILGRPITLEDVLVVVIGDNNPPHEKEGIELEHQIITITRGFWGVPRWKLNKPLHEQSEELINYLHSLVCQKK